MHSCAVQFLAPASLARWPLTQYNSVHEYFSIALKHLWYSKTVLLLQALMRGLVPGYMRFSLCFRLLLNAVIQQWSARKQRFTDNVANSEAPTTCSWMHTSAGAALSLRLLSLSPLGRKSNWIWWEGGEKRAPICARLDSLSHTTLPVNSQRLALSDWQFQTA